MAAAQLLQLDLGRVAGGLAGAGRQGDEEVTLFKSVGTAIEDLAAAMLFVFGVAGMALALMGTYGLVSYTVEQSTREIGIRMALGASGPSVVRGFLARGLRLGAIGVALGVVVARAASRFLGSVLYGVSATDALSFAGAVAVVMAGVVVASLVPAWRAARTNPLTALRHQ